jgi:hypothetical protein
MKTLPAPQLVSTALIVTTLVCSRLDGAEVNIDFEDGSSQPGEPIGTFYAPYGITFSNAVWFKPSMIHAPNPDLWVSGSVGLGAQNGCDATRPWVFPGVTNPIILWFDPPAVSVSIEVNDVGTNGAQLRAFDAGGAVVGGPDTLVGSGSGGGNGPYTLSAAGTGIRRVELTQPFYAGNTDGISFDNLRFHTSLDSILIGSPATNPANGHVYYLLEYNSWRACEQVAIALGGHLATVNNEAEQNWILSTFGSFGGAPRHLWIGLSDEQVEGTFVWANGDASTYRHWDSGEPNNYASDTGHQPFARVNAPNHPSAGWWWDVSGRVANNAAGVVEVVPGPAAQIAIYRAVEITWATQTTHRYQVQWTSQANTNAWFNLADPVEGTGGDCSVFDKTRQGSQRCYRVITLPR